LAKKIGGKRRECKIAFKLSSQGILKQKQTGCNATPLQLAPSHSKPGAKFNLMTLCAKATWSNLHSSHVVTYTNMPSEYTPTSKEWQQTCPATVAIILDGFIGAF
jgi:hypothetical protein